MTSLKHLSKNVGGIIASRKFIAAWTVMSVCLQLCHTLYETKNIFPMADYDFADLFLNYEGGFVRRGLLGQLLLACHIDGIYPPLSVIVAVILSVTAFIVIAAYMVRQFVRRGYNACLLNVTYLLGGFGIYGFAFMRRDYMIMCVFLAVVLLWKRLQPITWLIAANMLVSVCVLCYEPFALFAVPFGVLLTRVRLRKWLLSCLAWLPSVAVFLLCCRYSGGKEVYDGVWKSIHAFIQQPGILAFIARDTGEVMQMHLTYNFCKVYFGIPIVLITAVQLLCLFYYCCNAAPTFANDKSATFKRNYLLGLMIFGFVCLTPMWTCLSTDYGRTTVYLVLSSFIVYFTLSETELRTLLPQTVYFFADKVLAFSDRHLPPTRQKIALLLMFTGVVSWTTAVEKWYYILGYSTFSCLVNTFKLAAKNLLN